MNHRFLTGLVGLAFLGIAGAAPVSAQPTAPPILPPITFTLGLGGIDFKHTNLQPAGVTFDGAFWNVNPEWRILTIGWLADLGLLDTACATGAIVFDTVDGAAEVHQLAGQCANGYIYGFLSELPAREYRQVCASTAMQGDGGQRSCFRFINQRPPTPRTEEPGTASGGIDG
ncbi:hypothetical protein [Nocardia sp. NPDC052566]|uniref:hypothetical protein n=1 Tax=Nocardia sp. NPDC052566 TaxID=3364330 RepID=UPI0037C753BF